MTGPDDYDPVLLADLGALHRALTNGAQRSSRDPLAEHLADPNEPQPLDDFHDRLINEITRSTP